MLFCRLYVYYAGISSVRDPDISFGGPRRSSAKSARIEAPKSPRKVGRGEGVSPSPLEVGSREGAMPPPQKSFSIFYLKNGVFRSILMSKCASQYKPTSYNLARVKTSC